MINGDDSDNSDVKESSTRESGALRHVLPSLSPPPAPRLPVLNCDWLLTLAISKSHWRIPNLLLLLLRP